MTAELRFALEESNRVCKVLNYFGYTDAKRHAWETLPTRNDQLLAVLKAHSPVLGIHGRMVCGFRYCNDGGPHWDQHDYPCPTIQAIQKAAK